MPRASYAKHPRHLKSLWLAKANRYIYTLNRRPRQFRSAEGPGGPSQIPTLPHLPELYNPNFLDALLPPPGKVPAAKDAQDETAARTNPMMSLLESTTKRARTKNNAQAFRSTGDPLLDAFHRPQARFSPAGFSSLFAPAWEVDPEVTLRIIFYFRSIHEGKSDYRLFYRAWGWLYANHPRTAIYNLKHLVELSCSRGPRKGGGERLPGFSHGYWKDLLNILCLTSTNKLGTQDHFNLGNGERVRQTRGIPSRAVRGSSQHKELCERLSEDAKYQALYIAVARLFAEKLAQDVKLKYELESSQDGKKRTEMEWSLSLAGKWAPTPGCAHDRMTNISTAIAQLLHSDRGSHSWDYPTALADFDHSTPLVVSQAETLRSYFQRWFLTPLRATLRLPEPLMTANRWSEIRYDRVPSVCMQKNTHLFFKHDEERFLKYMLAVQNNKASISGAVLLPHEILMQMIRCRRRLDYLKDITSPTRDIHVKIVQTQNNVAIAQWRTLVERLRESGTLDGAIAICDVSGSMGCLHYDYDKISKRPSPLFPALAMSVLLASIARPPFNNGFITFSSEPQFLKLSEKKSVEQNVQDMVNSSWGMNTDLRKVFTNLLLPLAKQNNVKKEDMIKRLFIFSDMQFDEAGSQNPGEIADSWETNYDIIKKDFEAAGYDMPDIVYWDLGHQNTVEVQANRRGVAMMKGFSASMMKVFLGEGNEPDGEGKEEESTVPSKAADQCEQLTPRAMMMKAVMRKSFDGLEVLD
ncbi:hypothetical protein DRE_04357 [Drechslerella stenobrocha 248]|uniref:TROVE domain-containing protein n=1 Tax=Drechslerella stenobrocha 248 TaxID=1043628 RepID=W7HSZ3_9PEZI|nr:hypothetical protein DRE_04357 [Drechslerella stenobrocha 248]